MKACVRCGNPVPPNLRRYCSYTCRFRKQEPAPTTRPRCYRDGKPVVEWRTWCAMIQRCTNPRLKCWPRYGGRGIRVWSGWLGNYPAFLEHVGPRPTPEHSLDRYPDNDGDYEPGNVRWATRKEQANNKSRSWNVPEGSVPLGRPKS